MCVYVCIYVYVCVYVYVCMFVCVCVCIYFVNVHIYSSACTHAHITSLTILHCTHDTFANTFTFAFELRDEIFILYFL